MPHDKKGRLLEVGDHVKFKTWDGAHKLSVGRVFSVSPGSETCNVSVVHLQPGYWPIAQACVTAKETELVLKADGSEPMEDAEAGRAAVGVLAVLVALVALALPVTVRAQAPAAKPEPKCGTNDAPKACFSLTTGALTVKTRDVGREYATVGGIFESPVRAGFQAYAAGDIFAVQDGAALEGAQARTFRTIKIEAGVQRNTGPLQLDAHGGVTYSIEGQVGAPVDPRQWDALLDVRLPLGDAGHVAIRGGHDGAVGGWAAGIDVAIPIANGAPAIVARYELPLLRDPTGRVPWVITAGARVRVLSFRLGK